MFEERELMKTPIASALLEIKAIAASPLILLFLLNFRRRKAAMTTIGIDSLSGAILSAAAIEIAPNPTCDSPSPIIENLFNTRLTPRREAESATSSPTIKAFFKKSYARKSLIMSSIVVEEVTLCYYSAGAIIIKTEFIKFST